MNCICVLVVERHPVLSTARTNGYWRSCSQLNKIVKRVKESEQSSFTRVPNDFGFVKFLAVDEITFVEALSLGCIVDMCQGLIGMCTGKKIFH